MEEFVRLALPAGTASDSDRANLLKVLANYWKEQNAKKLEAGVGELNVSTPLMLSRGYDAVVPEDQLAAYLPEEKILINKELFRSKLDSMDLSRLDPPREKALIDQLKDESIGLTSEDVILYYNLIKVNSLAKRTQASVDHSDGSAPASYSSRVTNKTTGPSVSPQEVYQLAAKAFQTSPDQIVKLNSGKVIDTTNLLPVLQESLKRRRIALPVYAHYLGKHNDKYIRAVNDFMQLVIGQRGEALQDHSPYHMMYILLGGTDPKLLDALQLSPPLYAYLTDKIGRVRTVYYAALVFIHTFVYVICSQVTEIAVKYQNSDPMQQEKLKKLYASPERFGMLLTNASNLAGRRIEDLRVESREVQGLFKKFITTRKDLLSPMDLFETPVEL